MEDLHKIWPHRWIISKAEVRRSNIQGIGIFAKKDILKGEVVAIIGGIVIPSSEIKEYWKQIGNFGVQISDDFYIVPSTKKEVEEGGAFNHSCNPNVGWKGEVIAVAMCKIKSGEELLMDYGMYDSSRESFKCNCGDKSCKKLITANDWKLKKLQTNHFNYFAPYLKEKILKS